MNKTKNNNFPLFLAESLPSLPAYSISLFDVNNFSFVVSFNNIQSLTIDLPIAYANIRV